ncbi:putative D-3-phosphoglycerate dehydrogenase [Magnetospirillum gryphiswaldense MSR-1 v2]|uniref:D-3-phosphoglycerate dehydrogenase n=1 Tax=Magnetospirillum gryphiswaldense (strain DSM 6361 / JCM 21280 / NBRC 15271 / MSR-1) TaxID=431944 RepID=V6F562_MAGGM|nr:phosphoglycerate dehydrogenase [Magnetospirillum gryphiswaldense]CDL00655.1 putative D-3-phosphoglycerate dehydrogenase [Magnetospirillum gryphiswaldense MSR-1 v2]
MTRIAVCSRSFSRHPILRAELLRRFPQAEITFNDAGLSLSGQELIDFVRGHDRAITALERLDEAFFAALPELRVVGKYGVGLDMIDLLALQRHNVRLGWVGGVNRRSVSELVISCAIALLRYIPQGNAEVRSGQWRQLMGRQLTGKTVGIVGCGHIGKDLVTLLRAFDCKILAHDVLDFPDFYAAHSVLAVGLDHLLSESDVVTLHLPFDESTSNILGHRQLVRMKPNAILINAARGGLVDESVLKTMLAEGRLGGAAFDVFNNEPPEDMELLQLPNFLALPHIGGSAEEAVLAMGFAAIDGLGGGE